MTTPLPRVVWVLMAAQALSLSTVPLFFFSGGIVGNDLAPRPALATFPVACAIIGAALSVVPVTRLMAAAGRKRVFLLGAVLGCSAALLAAGALSLGLFYVFCMAAFLSGCGVAIAQQYRFAAIEAAGPLMAGRATSRVLLGGLVSAFVGPELVVWGTGLGARLGLHSAFGDHQPFIGAFLLLALVCTAVFALLALGYRNMTFTEDPHEAGTRGLPELLQNPLLWLAILASAMGYCMMTFIMTATPLSMHTMDGHTLVQTKWVLQSHIIAMFAPSFFSGWLISRLGHKRVIALGALAYGACLVTALAGHELMHYWWALVLLGMGWNFMFVAGTSLLPFCHRPAERFRVQTFNEFVVFTTQATAALCAGWVLNRYGWHTLIYLGIVMVLVIVAALAANRHSRLPAPA